jgi:glucose-6-phosphate dehydrogenase assembly protein OpcA
VAPAVSDGAARTAREEQALHRRLMEFGQAESLVTPMWDERETTVRAISAQLAELWGAQPTPADGDPLVREKGMPHARASVLNLIVVVVDSAAAERVVHTLMGLGERHPSRAIVLVPEHRAPDPSIGARISAHCHDTNGSDRVCYEEVVLTVRGEAASHLSGIVAPLLIPDLPTHIWWPGDPPLRHPAFEQLVRIGDRLLVDSSDVADLAAGLRRLTSLRQECGIGDLSWGRLGHWQELSAQFFDTPRFRRYLPNLSGLAIRYAVAPSSSRRVADDLDEAAPGVASPMAQSLLYAGWIATRLGWRRHRTIRTIQDGGFQLRLEGRHEMVDLRIDPEETDAVRPGDLLGIRLRSLGETGAAEFLIDREEDDAVVATNADGMTALLRRIGMPVLREPDLLSAQLGMDIVDPLYEHALRAATGLYGAAAERAA